MEKYKKGENMMWRILIIGILICCIPGVAFSLQDDQSAQSGSEIDQQAQEPDYLPVDNPGSIIEELEEDAERKDYIFQFPGVDRALKPWYDFKAGLYEKHGFRFGIAFTHLYQWASDTVGPEDDASGFDLNMEGVWTFLGRGTGAVDKSALSLKWR
jgi:hypothetical protein